MWKNKYRLNECGICGRGVYFYQPQLSVKDEWTEAVWHVKCAPSYDEWVFKMTEKSLKPVVELYEPDMWARLEEIQRREQQ